MRKLLFILLLFIGQNLLSQEIATGTNGDVYSDIDGSVYIFGSAITPFSPTDIAGCKLWLKADGILTKDGSNYVSQWNDESGNNNAIQSTLANEPKWIDGVLNGKPILRFDGNNDYLKINEFDLSSTDKITVFIVAKHTLNGAFNKWIYSHNTWASNTSILQYYSSEMQIDIYGNDGDRYTKFSSTSNNYVSATILDKSQNPDNIKYYLNGLEKTSIYNINKNNTGNFSNASFWIGTWSPLSDFLNGDIAELLIYNSSLSDIDRGKVETYLNTKYAIY